MRGCVELLDPKKPLQFMYSSKAIFAGDVYINRYTEKVIMPIFAQYLLGQPDEYTYDYSQHVNIPYPRYWLNSQKFDMTKIGEKLSGNPALFIIDLLNVNANIFDNLLPNDLFYLDRGQNSCGANASWCYS